LWACLITVALVSGGYINANPGVSVLASVCFGLAGLTNLSRRELRRPVTDRDTVLIVGMLVVFVLFVLLCRALPEIDLKKLADPLPIGLYWLLFMSLGLEKWARERSRDVARHS